MLEYVEPALIEQYQSRIGQHGYNMHKKVYGACSRDVDKRKTRPPCSDETRRKLSAAGKCRRITDELRQKLSKALKGHPGLLGRQPHNLGKPMSEKQKIKQSLARKGIRLSDTTRTNISKGHSSSWLIFFPRRADTANKKFGELYT